MPCQGDYTGGAGGTRIDDDDADLLRRRIEQQQFGTLVADAAAMLTRNKAIDRRRRLDDAEARRYVRSKLRRGDDVPRMKLPKRDTFRASPLRTTLNPVELARDLVRDASDYPAQFGTKVRPSETDFRDFMTAKMTFRRTARNVGSVVPKSVRGASALITALSGGPPKRMASGRCQRRMRRGSGCASARRSSIVGRTEQSTASGVHVVNTWAREAVDVKYGRGTGGLGLRRGRWGALRLSGHIKRSPRPSPRLSA